MSLQYRPVNWNRQKKIYDLTATALILVYLALFIAANLVLHPTITAETLLIRGLATCAFLMLHVILAIGPLTRLNPRFLPLLYNRRHLGVMLLFLALAHGVFSIVQFHSFGVLNPLVSLFVSNPHYGSLADFPFQALGFFALLILFLMAATSHDFWLANLSPRVWKSLHMFVYVAYALVVGHVSLGFLQYEVRPWLLGLTVIGAATLIVLHGIAGNRERKRDRDLAVPGEPMVDACALSEIRESRAKVVSAGGERIAIFRYEGKLSAVSNVCAHQLGPLGEGKIIDGCITCPWHGYQYLPGNGTSPPPFTEKIATYRVQVAAGRVLLDPRPNLPGTPVEPARIEVTS